MAQESWVSVGGVYGKIANYVAIGIDYLCLGPKCPVCGKHMVLSHLGGFMEAYQGIADTISGFKPERVCLNMKYPNPKFNPEKKMQREPKFIPCPNNYKFEWNPTMKMVVPRTKKKETFYRPFAPGFPARKVTKM